MSVQSMGQQIHLRNQEKLQRQSYKIKEEAVTGLKRPDSLSTQDLIKVNASLTSLTTAKATYEALDNLRDYENNASEAIESIQNVLNEMLTQMTAAQDPAAAGNIGLYATSYNAGLAQIQTIINTTLDSSGAKVLDGTIATYGPNAAAGVAAIAAIAGVRRAADASAAHTALSGNAVWATFDVTTQNALIASAAQLQAAYGANNFTGTVQYIANAMSLIPGIGISTTQINAPLADATKATKIVALLQTAVTNAIGVVNTAVGGAGGNLAAARAAIKTAIVSALVNEAIRGGVNVTAAAAPAAGAAANNAQAIRNELEPADIARLKACLTGVGDVASGASQAADGAANPAAILATELSAIFQNITYLKNIPGLVPNASTPATDLFGAVTGAAGTVTAGNVVPGNIFGNGAKDTISGYITTAATNRVANAKPYKVQTGPASSDTMSVTINDLTPAGLGNLDKITIIGTADAQTAVTAISAALQYVATGHSAIVASVQQAEAVQDRLSAQIDIYGADIERLRNTDKLENAAQAQANREARQTDTALYAFDISLESEEAQAARDLLRRG